MLHHTCDVIETELTLLIFLQFSLFSKKIWGRYYILYISCVLCAVIVIKMACIIHENCVGLKSKARFFLIGK